MPCFARKLSEKADLKLTHDPENSMNKLLNSETKTEQSENVTTQKPVPSTGSFRLNIMVTNKRGVLAKVSSLISKRGADIEELNFKPASKGNLSLLEMTVLAEQGQLRGILNDARKNSEIKGISVESP